MSPPGLRKLGTNAPKTVRGVPARGSLPLTAKEGVERGLQALAVIQDALAEAAEPYGDDIRRADRRLALRVAARTITSSSVHRAATCQSWPDGLTWASWADETTEMAVAYLTSPQRTTHH